MTNNEISINLECATGALINLINTADRYADGDYRDGFILGVTCALGVLLADEDIRNEPARHGVWIHLPEESNEHYNYYECSKCGNEVGGEFDERTEFCPFCGAEMWSKER